MLPDTHVGIVFYLPYSFLEVDRIRFAESKHKHAITRGCGWIEVIPVCEISIQVRSSLHLLLPSLYERHVRPTERSDQRNLDGHLIFGLVLARDERLVVIKSVLCSVPVVRALVILARAISISVVDDVFLESGVEAVFGLFFCFLRDDCLRPLSLSVITLRLRDDELCLSVLQAYFLHENVCVCESHFVHLLVFTKVRSVVGEVNLQ